MSDSVLFRFEITLIDRSVHTFDDLSASDVQGAMRAFTERQGDGFQFLTACGSHRWRWDEVRSCAAVLMVAVTDAEQAPRMIPDPADLLDEPTLVALRNRYGNVPAAALSDFPDRFANACDLAVQLLWANKYGAQVDDPDLHTSGPARGVAMLFCEALGVY